MFKTFLTPRVKFKESLSCISPYFRSVKFIVNASHKIKKPDVSIEPYARELDDGYINTTVFIIAEIF